MAKDTLPEAGAAVAEVFAAWASGLADAAIPGPVREAAGHALLDHVGLAISARREDYVEAALRAWAEEGSCTAFGHDRGFDMGGAALVNGTAAHGEDYDDTFEGTPVHTSAVVVPAVLATCERFGLGGADALRGMAVGAELMCRMALVAPTAQHRAGFHPTAVLGAFGAAAGAAAALKLPQQAMVDALGVAGSMASGIIEYLAEGTWTKRLHPGWSAQAGIRAALLGANGFRGPRTVMEGTHGFFSAFGFEGIAPDFTRITHDLGRVWQMEKIAFKPYACGTMTQPFIDCAIRLAESGIDPADIEDVLCQVGEGTVHRLWEPLVEKRRPSTPYSAKFSVPFCVAVGFVDRAAGLGQFTEERIRAPEVLRLAEKVRYEIDPSDEYPRNYTGTVIVRLRGGAVREERQPHLRGGAKQPLPRSELLAKFHANLRHGGWSEDRAKALADWCAGLFAAPSLSRIERFRG
ncbi:MAG: mmgE/PrpD family protein [Rhodospirillales bacterium]|nr:mmgE/PrpD family protein [Rhodospirillales bacterium]